MSSHARAMAQPLHEPARVEPALAPRREVPVRRRLVRPAELEDSSDVGTGVALGERPRVDAAHRAVGDERAEGAVDLPQTIEDRVEELSARCPRDVDRERHAAHHGLRSPHQGCSTPAARIAVSSEAMYARLVYVAPDSTSNCAPCAEIARLRSHGSTALLIVFDRFVADGMASGSTSVMRPPERTTRTRALPYGVSMASPSTVIVAPAMPAGGVAVGAAATDAGALARATPRVVAAAARSRDGGAGASLTIPSRYAATTSAATPAVAPCGRPAATIERHTDGTRAARRMPRTTASSAVQYATAR